MRLLWCIVALGAATAAAADDPKAPNMEAVGAQLATIFNERKADALVAMLDMGALGARVAANVFDSERGRSEFARGFAKTAQAKTLVSDIFGQLDRSPGSATKFMRVVTRGAEQRPLLRFDYGDSGFEYIEFVVQRDANGGVRIVDWAPLSGGELYSEVIGRMARILSDPAPGLVQTLLGIPKIDEATAKRMKAIAELRRKGDPRGAYEEMEKLPAAIADSRVMLSQRASLASEAGDDDAYRKVLARLEQLHGKDPAAAFMLLDHYYYTQDLDKVLQGITAIESRVGVDGMTEMLRANIYMMLGKHTEAVTYARKAIEVEPDMNKAYFTLAQSHVALGQFAEAVKVYTTLQKDFGYQFTKENFAQDATFTKFIDSPQFKKWLHE
ncbi:MAG TPA: tetratricopeptide repeat protein [Steroidobacteraceae bacterium]|nr:tetratricopeptide repeat protein [Steroidobacteraceae bacterium]